MVKIVIFDLDGTIADTLPMCTVTMKMAVDPYLTHPLTEQDIVATYGVTEEGIVRQLAGEKWELALNDFYHHYREMHHLCPTPIDGVVDIIKGLRARGIIVALVTGKGDMTCLITREKLGLMDLFDSIETGSPTGNRKAEAISNILTLYNLKSSDAVYIGDAVSDVEECRKVGVPCISAAWIETSCIDALERINSGNVLHTIAALGDKLNELTVA